MANHDVCSQSDPWYMNVTRGGSLEFRIWITMSGHHVSLDDSSHHHGYNKS